MSVPRPLRHKLFWCLPLLLSACAQEREPINRVQANALEKNFFVGALEDSSDDPTFFTRNLVIDASKSQSLVGISTASGVERIRWQITEDMLFARRAYAVVSGDDKGTSEDPNGDILAAYKIEAHFDIRRAYNPSTGEELNVIDENTSDRPWNQREFFRVDWSENLVNSPSWTTMFYGQVFGDIKLTPVSYFESDPNSQDAPYFEPEEGYFDVTSHFFVEPESTYWGPFQLPMCLMMGMFTGSAIYSCDPQEAVLRTSYWRVSEADPDDDFEPFENSRAPMDVIGNPGGIGNSASLGIVTPPREEFDPQYGYTDSGLRRYMNIHNLWKQSHQTRGSCERDSDCESVTGNGASVCLDSGACSVPCSYVARADGDQNGTDDQCENSLTGYSGSDGAQCSARDRCTVPYRDRETRTISYYVNPEMPAALQDGVSSKGKRQSIGPSEDLIETWNQALQLAVAHAREVECRRTGAGREDPAGKRAQCHAEFFEEGIQMVQYGGWGAETPKDDTPILVTCHNPVRSYDPKQCGDEGYSARVGDIRRNFLIYWPYATDAPYGGIGNWRADPLTGQILGAAATTLGPSATRAAAQVRDIALVALGELDLEDITGGVPAWIFQKQLREGRTTSAMTEEQLARAVSNVDTAHLGGQVSFDLTPFKTNDAREALGQLKATLTSGGELASQQLFELQALAAPLLDTEFETRLLDPNWLVDATGLPPSTELTQSVLNMASPLRGQDLGQLSHIDNTFLSRLGQRGICMFDAASSVGNPDLYGMGQYYRQKYPELTGREFADQVYEDLWRETYKGIQLHEIGHSLGLLHNFASSYDSLNYNPQYWQLRTHDGTSTASCNGAPRAGDTSSVENDTCMGPRYLDPETQEELGFGSEPRPSIDYFAHTSTMEYQGSRFFETVGLGQYDVMAMGVLYGRVLQTFDPNSIPQTEQAAYEFLNRTQLDESLSTIDIVNGQASVRGKHYTQLARQAGLFDPSRCRDATEAERAHAEWRVVRGKVCAPPPKDHGHWDDFVDTGDPLLSRRQDLVAARLRVLSGRPVPASGNVRWPFRFGGDIMNSYLHVNPFDVGADPYEVTMETIAQNEYNYAFNYFRRDRRGWTDLRLPSYTARMFYERLRSYHWGVSFTNAFYDEITQTIPAAADLIESWRNDDNELRPFLVAEGEMFRAITQTLLAPEPGSYAEATALGTDVYDLTEFGAEPEFGLDASNGRYISPTFDSSATGGGSWQYDEYVTRAGFSVEKALAARTLTDGRAVFFSASRDIYLDSRTININFRSDYPQGVDRLLGGVLAEDWETIAPYVPTLTSGATELQVLTRDFAGSEPAPVPDSAVPLFPNVGYNQQVPTIIYAYLFGRANGDLTLANKLRVWVEGTAGVGLDVPEAEQVRFSDPESGITYIARRFGPETLYGKEADRGIGSRMLARANALLAEAFVVETDDEGVPTIDDFGRPVLARDEDGALVPEDDGSAYARFRRYVGLVDANVQISALIGHGPFNW